MGKRRNKIDWGPAADGKWGTAVSTRGSPGGAGAPAAAAPQGYEWECGHCGIAGNWAAKSKCRRCATSRRVPPPKAGAGQRQGSASPSGGGTTPTGQPNAKVQRTKAPPATAEEALGKEVAAAIALECPLTWGTVQRSYADAAKHMGDKRAADKPLGTRLQQAEQHMRHKDKTLGAAKVWETKCQESLDLAKATLAAATAERAARETEHATATTRLAQAKSDLDKAEVPGPPRAAGTAAATWGALREQMLGSVLAEFGGGADGTTPALPDGFEAAVRSIEFGLARLADAAALHRKTSEEAAAKQTAAAFGDGALAPEAAAEAAEDEDMSEANLEAEEAEVARQTDLLQDPDEPEEDRKKNRAFRESTVRAANRNVIKKERAKVRGAPKGRGPPGA